MALAALVALTAPTPAEQGRREPSGRVMRPTVRGTPMTEATGRAPPHADGREFRTLDAYLAHLRDHAAPMDRPWYREVKPGLFRLETGNLRRLEGEPEPRLFTRDELERRFGFRR